MALCDRFLGRIVFFWIVELFEKSSTVLDIGTFSKEQGFAMHVFGLLSDLTQSQHSTGVPVRSCRVSIARILLSST